MKKTIGIILTSALITAAAIKATPALAQEAPAETRVSLVRTADLDLNSDAGRRQLDLRLSRAAREVCGDASDVDVEGKNEVRRCRDETLADARAKRAELLAAAGKGTFIAVAASR